VQVEPGLERNWFQMLKLKSDEPLSSFAFIFKSRLYTKAREIRQGRGGDGGDRSPNTWATKHGTPMLPGYQVSFEVVRGVHVCCSYVERKSDAVFQLQRRQGGHCLVTRGGV